MSQKKHMLIGLAVTCDARVEHCSTGLSDGSDGVNAKIGEKTCEHKQYYMIHRRAREYKAISDRIRREFEKAMLD